MNPKSNPRIADMKKRSFTRLSQRQIGQLCALANQAYKLDLQRGGVDDTTTAEQYRHAGQMEAANVASLKEAGQHTYLPILGKWFVTLGRLDEAFYAFLNAGPENEARRQAAWLLAGHVSHLAAAIGHKHTEETSIVLATEETARQAWAYTRSLAADKFGGRRIDSLDAAEIRQLMYTVINRTNAKRGVGDSFTRNKRQRIQRRLHKASPTQDDATEEPRSTQVPTSPGLGLVARAATRFGQGHQTLG